MCWEWLTLHRQSHVLQHFINLSGHTWTSGNMRSVLPTIYSVFHLSVLLPSNLKASPLVKTLLFTMIHMLKRALPLMAAEQHHFRWLNVSLWQTYNFLCMLTGFQSSLIDTHSQKVLYTWPIATSNKLVQRGHFSVCVFVHERVRMGVYLPIIRTGNILSWWCSNSFTGLWLPEQCEHR